MKETTAHKAWALLESLYRKKSRSTRTRLIAEFWNCTKNDAPMATYIATLQVLQSKLRAIGKDMTDEDMTDRLLSGLPSCFDAFTVTLDTLSEVKFAATAASLINFEAQLEHRSREVSAVSILPRACATSVKRHSRCSYHNSNSHDNAHCWAQHPELRPKHLFTKQSASVYPLQRSKVAPLSQQSAHEHSDEWLRDCCCSMHMCPESSTLQEVLPDSDPVTVTMANNESLCSTATGSS
ncbi:retrotransposon gag domain-containing protein, partial [Bacillus sp. SRB_331]|uniref:retrotransposon gag domain-containing protein n=1 Tax=Bacillus sp. SRB_331 TaxID=1969379 RepID=UPI000DC4F8E7